MWASGSFRVLSDEQPSNQRQVWPSYLRSTVTPERSSSVSDEHPLKQSSIFLTQAPLSPERSSSVIEAQSSKADVMLVTLCRSRPVRSALRNRPQPQKRCDRLLTRERSNVVRFIYLRLLQSRNA